MRLVKSGSFGRSAVMFVIIPCPGSALYLFKADLFHFAKECTISYLVFPLLLILKLTAFSVPFRLSWTPESADVKSGADIGIRLR